MVAAVMYSGLRRTRGELSGRSTEPLRVEYGCRVQERGEECKCLAGGRLIKSNTWYSAVRACKWPDVQSGISCNHLSKNIEYRLRNGFICSPSQQ